MGTGPSATSCGGGVMLCENCQGRAPALEFLSATASSCIRGRANGEEQIAELVGEVRLPHAATIGENGVQGHSGSRGNGNVQTARPCYFDVEAQEIKAAAFADEAWPSSSSTARVYSEWSFQTGAVYAGEWLNHKRDGYGVCRWPDGATYEGQWKEDHASGLGRFRHSNGDEYVGHWESDQAHGLGLYDNRANRCLYLGCFRHDLQDGEGIEIWAEGARFDGQFRDGKKHGFGIYEWTDGSAYAGEWVGNHIEGRGEFIGQDGRIFQGQWCGSTLHGLGRSVWPDGREYEGQYANDRKDGFGIFSWTDGRQHQGYWRDGLQHGPGTLHLEDGSCFKGEWSCGKLVNDAEDVIRPAPIKDVAQDHSASPNDNSSAANSPT